MRNGTRQGAHAQNVLLTRSHRDRPARIQQVEGVRRLQHHFVARQRQRLVEFDQALGFAFIEVEQFEQLVDVGVFEVVGGLLHFVLVEHIAVGHLAERAVSPHQVVDRVHALQVHGQAFQAIGDLARDRVALDAAGLLEVSELRHFHAIEPDFPAQAPGTQGWRFPVVFDETDVVHQWVQAHMFQRAQVQLLEVVRVGLQYHLELVVVLQTVRVFAVAAVSRAATGLHISGVPGFRADGPQECGGVESAGAYFHIVGLKYHTTLLGPVLLEGEDQVLEGTHGWRRLAHEIHLLLGLRFKEREYTRFGPATTPWSLMPRCFWCSEDPLYMAYHDQEWGTPLRDAQGLFELLLLEGFQAGLSWITVLRKRERYRQVLFGFDVQRVAQMSDAEIDELMLDPGIIRNRLKLNAARRNAQAWLALEDPVALLWSFVGDQPIINHFKDRSEVPAITPEALAMSKALKKAGFTFVGPTICYALMQASGMVMDHTQDCDRYAQLANAG